MNDLFWKFDFGLLKYVWYLRKWFAQDWELESESLFFQSEEDFKERLWVLVVFPTVGPNNVHTPLTTINLLKSLWRNVWYAHWNHLKSTKLFNLWWISNSVGKGVGTAMWMGLSCWYPTTYMWVSCQLSFTGLSKFILIRMQWEILAEKMKV